MSNWRKFSEARREKDEQYGETLRALLKQENDLTNQRTTWMLVAQALLAAAASNLFKEHPGVAIGIAVIGIIIATSIGYALYNSLRSRMYFKRLWRQRVRARGYDMDDILPIDGAIPGNIVKWWLLPNEVLPAVIIAGWGALIIYVYLDRFAK
jgi:hypothetical protein